MIGVPRSLGAAALAVLAIILAACAGRPGHTATRSAPSSGPPSSSASSASPVNPTIAVGTPTATMGISPATSPNREVVAHDESVVATLNGNCAAFEPTGSCSGLFTVDSTPNGNGGTLYAVELGARTGDQCSRGSVYFFDGESLLPNASQLPPSDGQETDGGLDFVSKTAGISSPGPDEIAVLFVVSKPDLPAGRVSCAAAGNAGTDTYVYRENGSAMQLVSGQPPAPPKVIGLGSS
ncbi:MAG: hypothetical protein QOG36_295 [Actinomycetota bacterium]|nr:hypothetical protein [Actinomycetota bacterium]